MLLKQIQNLVAEHALGQEIAATLVHEGYADFFRVSAGTYTRLKPTYIADLLLSLPQQVKVIQEKIKGAGSSAMAISK